jgi:N-acetylglutamate synthase-like GNAT family acetyltransferase
MIELIEYADQYAKDFKAINLEWLDKYSLLEEPDLLMLNDPRGRILDNGGVIYLAKAGQNIIGSAALIHEHDDVYELAKMTVVPSWRGKGISKMLLEKCLDKAREVRAKKIILFSNHQLGTALGLYQKYGFQHVAVEDSPFETADVKMELHL